MEDPGRPQGRGVPEDVKPRGWAVLTPHCPRPEPTPGARLGPKERWTLVAVVLGSGMVFLDGTVVSVALPAMAEDLPIRLFGVLEAQSYVYTGYLLSLSALLVLGGALGDYCGRRLIFAVGLAGFGLTSILCAVAPTMEVLIAGRVLQGVTGALLVPGSLAIITECFEGEQRGRAFGVWAAASAATTVVGPMIGGILVDLLSWRALFYMNVPFAVVAVAITVRWVPETRDETATGRFDWTSAAVVAIAMGGLTLGAIRGQERDWADPTSFALLAVGLVALVAVPFTLRRSDSPLVPLHLFRSRTFNVTNLSTLVVYGGLFVMLYLLVIYLQGTIGYTAAAAGVVLAPGMVFVAVFSTRFGALAARYGPRWFMAAGPAIMALGALWLTRMPSTSAPWRLDATAPRTMLEPGGYLVDVLPAILLVGAGLMIMVAPLTTALMDSIPTANAGVGSAVNNAISRVGPQLAGAAVFVAVTVSFRAALAGFGIDPADPGVRALIAPLNAAAPGAPADLALAAREASTTGFHVAMVASAALFLAGALTSAIGIRGQPVPSEAPSGPATAPTTG
jgi:EmrB/QacA subfamily drug resistance transporter